MSRGSSPPSGSLPCAAERSKFPRGRVITGLKVFLDDLPDPFQIEAGIAMGSDISKTVNIPPGDVWMALVQRIGKVVPSRVGQTL